MILVHVITMKTSNKSVIYCHNKPVYYFLRLTVGQTFALGRACQWFSYHYDFWMWIVRSSQLSQSLLESPSWGRHPWSPRSAQPHDAKRVELLKKINFKTSQILKIIKTELLPLLCQRPSWSPRKPDIFQRCPLVWKSAYYAWPMIHYKRYTESDTWM